MNQATIDQRAARKQVRLAIKVIKKLRGNDAAMKNEFVREQVIDVESDLEHLLKMIKEICRYCGKKVPFGCTTCAGCADERGP